MPLSLVAGASVVAVMAQLRKEAVPFTEEERLASSEKVREALEAAARRRER